MTKKKKQTYTVHFSLIGVCDFDIEADSPEKAIELAEDSIEGDWYKHARFDMDCFQVTDKNGDVVWEI